MFWLSLSTIPTFAQADPPCKSETESGCNQSPSGETPRYQVKVVAPPVLEGNSTDRYGSLITTVSNTQIDELNAQDLASALRRIPGVSISRYDLIGSYGGADGGAVYIRGQGSGRPGAEIATLIDGVPRFVGVWTHPLIDTLSIDRVERIDVYKSPQPVLFGNMAFAAINLLPRVHRKEGYSGAYTGAYGRYDTWLQRVQVGGRQSRFDFDLNGSFRRSDGHRENSAGQTWAADGTVGVQINESWRLSAYLSHTDGWADDPGTILSSERSITPRFNSDDNFYLVNLSHDSGRWSGSLKFYSEDGRIDWLQWDSATTNSFRTVTDYSNFGLRLQERFRPWENGEILFGFDQDSYGGASVELRPSGSRNPSNLRFRNSAPYLMLSQVVDLGSWTLTPSAGVRVNASRYFGEEWAPQAGITLDHGKTRLYANFAHAFNLPGVYAAALYSGWGRGDQWKSLRPERIDHLEGGLIYPVTPRARISWSVYHDKVEDALRFVPPPPPPPQFANVGGYRVVGTELSLDCFLRDNLAVFSGVNFQDAEPESIPNAPRRTWVSGISYLLDSRWRFNADAEWVDRQFVLNPRYAVNQVEVEPYFLLNGRVGFQAARRFGVFVAAENLTGEQYEFRPGYPMPGRTVMVGMNFDFAGDWN